jgi:hypothetical protein
MIRPPRFIFAGYSHPIHMEPHPPADWFEFWVRFVCGALFGGVVGFFTFAEQGWLTMLATALAFGAVAGWWGDRFWHTLGRWF